MAYLNPGGQFEAVNRDGTVEQWDSYTCSHCNSPRRVPHKQKPTDTGGFCSMCNKPICKVCDEARHASLIPSGHCAVFERQLDASENRRSVLKAIGYDPNTFRPGGRSR